MTSALLTFDPLLVGGLKWTPLILLLIKVVLVFVIALVATMFMVWYERKVVAGMQNRIGPNKAGPFGLLQTLADGTKLFFKEDLLPNRADRFVFRLSPFLAVVPAFLIWAVIPLGGDFSTTCTGEGAQRVCTSANGVVTLLGQQTRLQLADPPVGILLVLALSSIAVYGVMLAGWSSGSKYPLLGSVRASAQMVSYEAALGLSVAAVLLATGTLTTSGIVGAQERLVDWTLISTGLVPFVIFVIAVTAEMNRPPFDLVEAEQELVGGFNTEYSSIRFAMFFLAEFMNTVTMSGVIVTLFLGGPRGLFDIPFVNNGFEGVIWFVAKTLVFMYMYVWFRGTLPRLRYDQLMDLGWKILIPISLGWFLLLAGLRIRRSDDVSQFNLFVSAAIGFVVLAALGALLLRAVSVSRRNRDAAAGLVAPEGVSR